MDFNKDYYKPICYLQMGHEHTLPQLAQYQNHVQIKQVLENIRHSPDFIFISENKEQVFLVEVKFRYELNQTKILKQVEEINQKWQPCFMFVATEGKFYFSFCTEIITQNGEMNELSEYWISKNIQQLFRNVLNEFI